MFSVHRRVTSNHASNRKATEHPSREEVKPAGQWGYTQLPAELRNDIMHRVLVPGTIYLPQVLEATGSLACTLPPGRDVWKCRTRERARTILVQLTRALIRKVFIRGELEDEWRRPTVCGSGLLATSRMVHHEASGLYYSCNTFYLPRGPVSHCKYLFGNINPQYKRLIRSVGVQFSRADLTLDVIDHIDAEICKRRLRRPAPLGGWSWQDLPYECLILIWQQKLEWIRQWEGLDEVILQFGGGEPMIVKGDRDLRPLSTTRLKERPHIRKQSFSIHDFDVDICVLKAQKQAQDELDTYHDWEVVKLDLIESAFYASSGYRS